MSLLIPELERQLREVVRAGPPGRFRFRAGRLRGWRAVAIAAAALPAVAVVLIAVALVGHRGTSRPAAGPPSVASGVTRPGPCARVRGAVAMDAPTALVTRSAEATQQLLDGSIGGHRWTVRARSGTTGFRAIQAGRLTLDGRSYGMCGAGANTTAVALIDKQGQGVVYGYVVAQGPFSIRLHATGPPNNGAPRRSQVIPLPDGAGKFFIAQLPLSACRYRSLTLDVLGKRMQSTSTINFGTCQAEEPVAVTSSAGTATGPVRPGVVLAPRPGRLVATIALHPPAATGTGTASGILRELLRGSEREVTISASGLKPNTKHNAYAVWLYKASGKRHLLGFVNPAVRRNGRLKTAGILPQGATSYTTILITLETSPNPRTLGQIVLTGTGPLR